MNEYYGYFLNEDVPPGEAELYSEVTQQKMRQSKIKSYGKKNYFNEQFRHCFWFNALNNTLKIT
jgi:hypothetical protein